jgi:hypothetical protein
LETTDVLGGFVVNVAVRLYNPDEFLNRVVEVELDLVGGRVDGFFTSELELFNEVFVADLYETSTFINI